MKIIRLSDLEIALEQSWCKETSFNPKTWTTDNPAGGQCAVTALIVQDYLGGEIIRANVNLSRGKDISHYFNLIGGKEVDLTRKQFPKGTKIPKGVPRTESFSSTREYVLSYEKTKEKYQILKEKMEEYFNE